MHFPPAHTLYTHHTHILGTPSVFTTKPVPRATYSTLPSPIIQSLFTSHLKLALEHLPGGCGVEVGHWGEALVTGISLSS